MILHHSFLTYSKASCTRSIAFMYPFLSPSEITHAKRTRKEAADDPNRFSLAALLRRLARRFASLQDQNRLEYTFLECQRLRRHHFSRSIRSHRFFRARPTYNNQSLALSRPPFCSLPLCQCHASDAFRVLEHCVVDAKCVYIPSERSAGNLPSRGQFSRALDELIQCAPCCVESRRFVTSWRPSSA